ncbi:hypothetical protein FGB62_317g06 [Gracilaria domingensis]|nr:hypothetical protein FGB62_317g06 [Gracilaria domingensis]
MFPANTIRTQENPKVHDTDGNHEHECPNEVAEIRSCVERGDVGGGKDVGDVDISTCGQKRESNDANIGNRRKVKKHNRMQSTSKKRAAVEQEQEGIERRPQAHERPMAGKKHKNICRQPSAVSCEESSESDVDYEDDVNMSHNLVDANDSDLHHQDQEGSEDVLDNSQDIEISETESEIERMKRRRRRAAARIAKGHNANRQTDGRTSSKMPSSASRPHPSTRTRQPKNRRLA